MSLFTTGPVRSNPTQWNGVDVATPDVAGYPKVTVLKRVQYGTFTFAAGGTTVIATLANAVDVSKAVLIFLGFTVNGVSGVERPGNQPYITLTNTTTVTATRANGADQASANVTGTGTFVVVEFN